MRPGIEFKKNQQADETSQNFGHLAQYNAHAN